MAEASVEYGRTLRARRIACGLTQNDLASLAGVAMSTVRNIETARVSVARVRDKVETALREFEAGAHTPASRGPALLYLDATGTAHEVDADDFDISSLSPRDQMLYRALLTHALKVADGEAS